ncbi:MAG: twin-arginine translocation signal domain-containing protein [Acetobacteraceae bacterium]
MIDDSEAPRLGNRRDFLKTSAAAMAVAAAYGLYPGRGLAQNVPNQFDGSGFQLQAQRAQRQARRRAEGVPVLAPAAFRHSPVRHVRQHQHDVLHVRQSDPA